MYFSPEVVLSPSRLPPININVASTPTIAMADDVDALRARLDADGQSHLLRFWPQLSDAERASLRHDLASVDTALLRRQFVRALEAFRSAAKLDDKITPLPRECQVGGSWPRVPCRSIEAAVFSG